MLEARRLVKRFHGHAVVDHVSFAVQAGEVVGYLGPNGSGKTTTTRILTGLLDPTSGAVLFDGREVRLDPLEFRRRLGYVPDEPHLYSFLSGREHLELVGRLREMPPVSMDRKINALLELFGLSDAAEQGIAAYSKGMKQTPPTGRKPRGSQFVTKALADRAWPHGEPIGKTFWDERRQFQVVGVVPDTVYTTTVERERPPTYSWRGIMSPARRRVSVIA